MYAVNALYDGTGNVKIDPTAVLVNTPYKVIVTFVESAQELGGTALAELEKFEKLLPAGFDYKKERDVYYEERYENHMRSH